MKIPLDKAKFDEFYEKIICAGGMSGINILDCSAEVVFKQDEYFSKYKSLEEREKSNEPQVIRIRTEGVAGAEKKSYFTIKRKTLCDGVEVNREDETFIEDADVLREFFEEAGYWRWFNKEKKAYSAHCGFVDGEGIVFHVELVTVNGMPYIEIEVTDENIDSQEATALLNKFVCMLGLNPADKDSRSWYKIISSQK